MINPAQIPDEVVEAAALSICRDNGWPDSRASFCTEVARAAIAAALNAWPGMTLHQQDINAEYSYFVLPLPQEASDDKA